MRSLKISILLFVFAGFISHGQTVYEWRSNDRNGIFPGSGLLKEWPSEGPRQVLELTGIGNGYGSPIFTSDGFFITGEKDTVAWLFSFALDGTQRWKAPFGEEWVKSFPGSRSAPTIVGDLLYVTSGMGNLYCFETKTGKKVWSVDKIKDLNGIHSLHGHSESPVVLEDMVFLNPGGTDTNFVALNRFTGKIIWTLKGNGEPHGYNSPRLIRTPKYDILVSFSAYALMGIDVRSGKVLWTHEQTNTPLEKRKPGIGDTHSNTVLSDGKYIYYVAGDGNGGVKLELTNEGAGIKEVWVNSTFDGYMGGLIIRGGNLYSCTTARRDIKSADINTGIYNDSLKIGPGALIAADDLFYYYNQKGEVSLISLETGKMDVKGSFKVTKGEKEHFAHPVINKGVLYIRHGDYLLGYDIEK